MKKILPIILIIVVVVAVFGFGTYKIYETKEAEKAETIQLAKLEEEKLAKAEAEKLAKAEAEKLAKEAEAKAEAEKLAKEAEAKAEAEKLAKEEEEKLAKEKAEAEAKGVEDLNIGTHYLDENKVESTSKPETKPKPKPETKPETTKKDPYEKLGSFFDIPETDFHEQNEWALAAADIWIATQPSGQEPSNAGLKAQAKMMLEMVDLQIGDWNPKHDGWEYIDETGRESIIIPGGMLMDGVGWN